MRSAFLVFLLAPLLFAQDVTVGNFGGTGNSTNDSFIGGVWTPSAASQLDYADLQLALDAGDITITTQGAGVILINPVFSGGGNHLVGDRPRDQRRRPHQPRRQRVAPAHRRHLPQR